MPENVTARIGFLLSRLGSSSRASMNTALAPLGLRTHHYGALKLLQRNGPLSQQSLADTLQVDRSVMVGVVDHLESFGAVERRPDPSDRRRHALLLTAAGQNLITEADLIAERLQEERLAPLSPRQRVQLLELLGILARHDR